MPDAGQIHTGMEFLSLAKIDFFFFFIEIDGRSSCNDGVKYKHYPRPAATENRRRPVFSCTLTYSEKFCLRCRQEGYNHDRITVICSFSKSLTPKIVTKASSIKGGIENNLKNINIIFIIFK